MTTKSDVLLKTTKEMIESARVFGVDLIICGGIGVHVLSNVLKRDSPRPWNHKDIDFVVPLSQFQRAISFFKTLGYTSVFVPNKKSRLTENHIRFGNQINKTKILVDLYGVPKLAIIKIEQNNNRVLLLSPRIELENWKDRQKRIGSTPSINLTIEFLEHIIDEGLFTEEEIT